MGGVATEPQTASRLGQRTRKGGASVANVTAVGLPQSSGEDGATSWPDRSSPSTRNKFKTSWGWGGDSFWRVCPFPTALMLDNERSVNAVTFESNRSATKRGRRAVAGAFWRQTSGPPTLGNANRRGMEVSQLTVSVEVGWNAGLGPANCWCWTQPPIRKIGILAAAANCKIDTGSVGRRISVADHGMHRRRSGAVCHHRLGRVDWRKGGGHFLNLHLFQQEIGDNLAKPPIFNG